MKKWTKRDIKIMCQTISTFWLVNRPLGFSAREHASALAEVREYLREHRTQVVCRGIADLGNLAHSRYLENAQTAEHFKTHPNVYGSSTPEMIERFTNLAAESLKDFEKAKALIERVEREGLPDEVVEYDPA